ncbi:MAG: hypothetical protein HYZ44_04630 [Bacteroidetes bacterium]|nr:hypothetical protein [Bacteroidota bacterium]
MKHIPLIILFILLMSCAEQERTITLQGDLYFDTDKIGSFYGMADSIIQQIKQSIDSMYERTDRSGNDEFLTVYESLKEHHVLYKPFVDVYMPGDSVIKLYLDTAAYHQFDRFDYHDLIGQKKKVRIEARTKIIRKGFYDCVELTKVELVAGSTYPIEKNNQ